MLLIVTGRNRISESVGYVIEDEMPEGLLLINTEVYAFLDS